MLQYPRGFRTVSSRRQEATAFPHIHGTVKSLICQSIKNSYQSFVVCKRLLDVALCDSSRKWEKTIGANGDVYSRPESKKKKTQMDITHLQITNHSKASATPYHPSTVCTLMSPVIRFSMAWNRMRSFLHS